MWLSWLAGWLASCLAGLLAWRAGWLAEWLAGGGQGQGQGQEQAYINHVTCVPVFLFGLNMFRFTIFVLHFQCYVLRFGPRWLTPEPGWWGGFRHNKSEPDLADDCIVTEFLNFLSNRFRLGMESNELIWKSVTANLHRVF